MRRWDPLNPRQLEVLQQVAGDEHGWLSSYQAGMGATVNALRDRGLITTRRVNGGWDVTITAAGHFYLDHGHHPDRYSHSATSSRLVTRGRALSRQPTARPKPETPARLPQLEVSPEMLIQQLRQTPTITLADPDARTRTAWLSALHNINQRDDVPDGHHVRHRGRNRGDLVIELIAGAHPSEKYRTRPVVPIPEQSEAEHRLAAQLRQANGLPDISEQSRERALRLVAALAHAMETRGHQVRMPTTGETGHWCFVIGDDVFSGWLSEGTQVVEEFPDPDAQQGRSYPWQRLQPRLVTVPSGQLTLSLEDPHERHYYGRRRRWSDTRRWRLESKLADVILAVEDRARQIQQERHVAAQAAHAAQLAREEAKIRAQQQRVFEHRVNCLTNQLARWEKARQIRAYCQALEQADLATADPPVRDDLERWVRWARQYADSLDPLTTNEALWPDDLDATPEALPPYLDQVGRYNPHHNP